MATILGRVFNGLLYQKNLLYTQAINNIRKYAVIEPLSNVNQTKTYDNDDNILETLKPLLNVDNISHDICSRVRNDMISKHSIPENIVDNQILDICIKYNKSHIATAYVNCFEHTDTPLSIFVVSKYLLLYKTTNPKSNFEENLIIDICNRISKEMKYIPELISYNCIIALCQTYKWKYVFELLKKSDFSIIQHSNICQYIITAAYKNNCPSIGENMLFKLKNMENIHCNTNLYKAYLNYYLQEPKKVGQGMEKMFIFWNKNDLVPTKMVADLFVNACNETGLKATYVTMNRKGKCHNCNNQLYHMPIQVTEFNKLVKKIIPQIIVKKDIFQSTTPNELKHFKHFISKKGPFDIVIDALNVAKVSRHKTGLKLIVRDCANKYKNVLVITRKHMRVSKIMTSELENVQVYFLDNHTEDDTYLLYATLSSGIHTKFITTDLLRGHVYNLCDENLRKVFRRWQYTHQYYCSPNSYTLIEPLTYDPYAQENNGYWHIPYRMESQKRKLLCKPVDSWLCVDLSNIKHLK